MQNMMMDTPRKRPVGVTIIAVLLGIQGILEVLIGAGLLVFAFRTGHTIRIGGHTTAGTIVDILGSVLGGTALVVGIITLIFTWGLWTLKRWAFWATVIIVVLNILARLAGFIQSRPNITSIVISLIIPVAILLYFMVYPQVRHAFRT